MISPRIAPFYKKKDMSKKDREKLLRLISGFLYDTEKYKKMLEGYRNQINEYVEIPFNDLINVLNSYIADMQILLSKILLEMYLRNELEVSSDEQHKAKESKEVAKKGR